MYSLNLNRALLFSNIGNYDVDYCKRRRYYKHDTVIERNETIDYCRDLWSAVLYDYALDKKEAKRNILPENIEFALEYLDIPRDKYILFCERERAKLCVNKRFHQVNFYTQRRK